MAGSIVYMTGSTDPWYVKPSDLGSPDAAMNTSFGVNSTSSTHWTKYQGYSTAAIDASNTLLYIDGGYQDSTAFDAYVSANISALQTYVFNGGILFLNASRYDTADQTLGFGITLKHGYSASATAVIPSSSVFQGPGGATVTSFTGGYFANDYLVAAQGSNFVSLINGTSGSVLGYEKYGTGMVVFGSMSDPKYDLPLTQAEALRANILNFADNAFVPVITVASPGTVEQGQTTIIGNVLGFQPGDTLVLTETKGSGTVSLGGLKLDGSHDVMYLAPGTLYPDPTNPISVSVIDNVGFKIVDTNHLNAPDIASAIAAVQLDRGPIVAAFLAPPGTVEASQFIQIGTVTPGIVGDTLHVSSNAAGKVTLGTVVGVNGQVAVLYQAPAVVATSHIDHFAYTVTDQYNDVAPVAGVTVALDAGPKITALQPGTNVPTGTIEIGQVIKLGTVQAGYATDTLSIAATATGGTVTLGSVQTNGVYDVNYTATVTGQNLADTFSYTVKDQYNDATATSTALVQLDNGPSIGTLPNLIVGHGLAYVVTLPAAGATPGLAGDTLKFSTGTATLGTESASSPTPGPSRLTYTAPNSTVQTADTFTYLVSDQYNDVKQTGTGHVTVDPGPAALDVTGNVTVGKTLAVGSVTPGLTVDVLSLSTTGAKGTLSLASDGTLVYTANGSYNLPSFGSVVDSFTYTVSDQWGDTITKHANITVNNIINYITGPTYGNATTYGGSVGDNVVTLTGFNNTLILSPTSSDVVTGGDGATTITKGNGDLTSHLRGYGNTINAGIGSHTIDGSAGTLDVSFGNGNNSISFSGYQNTIIVGNGNNVIFQPGSGGGNVVKTGDGTQTIVLDGANNQVTVGNNTGPGFNFINAGPVGGEVVTAGDGNNYILAGGFGDTITVGNGTAVIFATATTGGVNNPSSAAALPNTGVSNAGMATVSLGNTAGTAADFFVFLGGSSNTVFLGSSTGGHLTTVHGGTGSDAYVVAAHGGNSVINDFQMAGSDKIDVSQFFTAGEFASLGTHVTVLAGGAAGEALVTLTGAHGGATLDLFGVTTPTSAQILPHLTWGH